MHRLLQGHWPRVLVLVATVVPYLNSLDGGFHYDDDHALVRNTHIRQLTSIPSFFVDSSTFSAEPDMAMYRPVLQTTFALNYALSGYDARAWHVANMLLHGVAALGVLALCRTLVGPGTALTAALLFALHPVQSQAVNYLSSRSEVLSMALVLWALVLIQSRRIGLSLALYAAALMTKSAAMVLLPVGILLELARSVPRTGRRRGPWALVRRLLPHAVLSVVYVLAISLEGFLPRSLGQHVRAWDVQLWTQVKALTYYLQLVVMPRGLAPEHDFSLSADPWSAVVLLSLASVGSLIYLTARAYVAGNRTVRRQPSPVWWLGAPLFGAALLIPFVVPLNVLINEHRLYLALLGPALLVATALRRLQRPWRGAVSLAGLVLFGVLVIKQNSLWQNELSLWSHTVGRAPQAPRAWSNLSLARYDNDDMDGASVAAGHALRLNPGDSRTWNNVGLLLEQSGRLAEAAAAFTEASARSPQFSGGLVNLGRLALARGDLDGAEAALEQALMRNPRDALALLHRGRLQQARGQVETARESYLHVLRLQPHSVAAANNLAMLAADEGDHSAAMSWLQRALAWDPQHEAAAANVMLLELEAEGLDRRLAYERVLSRFPDQTQLAMSLGSLYGRSGDWSQAARVYRSVLQSGQYVAGLRAALGQALLGAGAADEALVVLRQATREAPADVSTWNALAAAAAAVGALDEARQATESALRIDPHNAPAKANLRRLAEAAENGG